MGQTVSLCGWVHRRRDHGGVIFIDLRDREGLVQVVCDPDRAEMFKSAESVRNEFCLRITGLVRARPSKGAAPDPLKTSVGYIGAESLAMERQRKKAGEKAFRAGLVGKPKPRRP